MAKEKRFERSWVEIDLSALQNNLQTLKNYLQSNQNFMMIVKADAYGHGASEISRVAIENGAIYLGVANPEEGRLLRIQGCKAPIMVLSPSLTSEIAIILENELTTSVSELDFAKALNREAAKLGCKAIVHLKADTGMHRSGVDWQDFLALYTKVSRLNNLVIEGVFSHFASSESDVEFCQIQEARFYQLTDQLPVRPKYIHINNSHALLNGFGAKSNLVRLGIVVYGITATKQVIESVATDILSVERNAANRTATDGTSAATRFQPVMTFKTTLSQIKTIRKGETVGYNRSWIAKTDGLYGILPVGYADGYDFLLSNCGLVMLKGQLCKVIGRISMDMICIDLNDVESPAIGDVATMLGGDNASLHAENLVANYGGNPYELLCQVGRRAKRFYYIKGKLLHSTPLSRRDFVPDDFSDSKLNQIIESAIAQRLQSSEIGELIYREILRNFFYNKDKDIHYRHNFHHEITFSDSLNVGYFKAATTLSFSKVLQNEYFIVACASSDEVLRRYFKRSDVEYRWLMDNAIELDTESFVVSSVMVNNLVLKTEIRHVNGCLEIKCFHPQLSKLTGQMADFTINTQTLYPKASHQFSVFISELTRGVDIAFHYPPELDNVECVPVFSGQDKYPAITRKDGLIRLSSQPDEWVFPISGVVFAY